MFSLGEGICLGVNEVQTKSNTKTEMAKETWVRSLGVSNVDAPRLHIKEPFSISRDNEDPSPDRFPIGLARAAEEEFYMQSLAANSGYSIGIQRGQTQASFLSYHSQANSLYKYWLVLDDHAFGVYSKERS